MMPYIQSLRRIQSIVITSLEIAISIYATEVVVHALLVSLEHLQGKTFPACVQSVAMYAGITVFGFFVVWTIVVHVRHIFSDIRRKE